MANTGDYYIVTLNKAHLGWGTHRYTNTRLHIPGERYLPIPRADAIKIGIFNSNETNGNDVPGLNIFYCTSVDGYFNATFKAQGCSRAGDRYAKQFSVDDDLQALREWYDYINAQPGDQIRVTWTSPTEITIERI